MHDIPEEPLFTLTEARARIPGRPSIETLWRWRTRGCGGHRLETVKLANGRVYVSEKALKRFLQLIVRVGTTKPNLAERHRRDSAELAKAGI